MTTKKVEDKAADAPEFPFDTTDPVDGVQHRDYNTEHTPRDDLRDPEIKKAWDPPQPPSPELPTTYRQPPNRDYPTNSYAGHDIAPIDPNAGPTRSNTDPSGNPPGTDAWKPTPANPNLRAPPTGGSS
jgi:hypothetical protein